MLRTVARATDVEPGHVRAFEIREHGAEAVGRSRIPLLKAVGIGRAKDVRITLANVAGALFAHQIQFINPSSFDIIKSTEILVMVYLGGIGSLAGSILGAVIFTFLSQALQPLGTWRMVIMPLILVFLMLFRPRGILGLRELIWFLPERELSRGRQT